MYDPRVAVDHFPAERFDDDRRDAQTMAALRNAAFNFHLILRDQLPPLRRETAWWWWTLSAHASIRASRMRRSPARVETGMPEASRWRAVRTGAHEARRALSRAA